MRRLLLALILCAFAAAAHATCTNSQNPIKQGFPGAPFTCDTGTTPQSSDIVQGGQVATGNTVGWTWAQIFAAFGTTAVPGGSTTQLQFNNAGAFGGDASLLFNSSTKALTASSLNLTLGGTALSLPAGSNAVFSGATNLTGPVFNALLYGADASGTNDSTTAIRSAVTAAIATGVSATIYWPCGTYKISAAISITTASAQGINLRGELASCVTILQTADADGFDISLTNYGGLFGTGAFSMRGITLGMTAASTTRTAISIATTASSGTTGVPLVMEDITLTSASAGHLWGTGINLSQIPNFAYLNRINSIYPNEITAGTHITVSGNSTSYSTSIFIRDSSLVSGLVGVSLGSYLQGIHADNLTILNAATAWSQLPTAGINAETQLANSYFNGKVIMSPTSPGTMNTVKMTSMQFDGDTTNIPANSKLVDINNVAQLQIANCLFNGPVSAVAGMTGLSIRSTAGSASQLVMGTGNNVQAFFDGGVGISIGSGVTNAVFNGTYFANNSTNVVDSGTNTQFTNTQDGNAGSFYLSGTSAVANPITVAGALGVAGASTFSSSIANIFSPTVATGGTTCTTTQYGFCQFSRPSGTVSGIAFANSQTLDDTVNSSSNVIDNNYQINVGGGTSTGGATTSGTTPAGAPQTAATSALTASGSPTLTFTSTPGFCANAMVIEDVTTPAAIPANTLVNTGGCGATTVTMTNNAAGAGVGSGDLIAFYAAGSNVLTFSATPAGWTVGNNIADQTGSQVVAGTTIAVKTGTTVTLTHPVVALVSISDQFFAFSTYTAGNRVGSSTNVTQITAGMASTGISSGGGASIWMQSNLGGNALNHVGAGNGANFGCTSYATALWTKGCSGVEIDMIRLTATSGPQAALVLVENGSSLPSGSGGDTAIFIGASATATSVFHYGIDFGAPAKQWAEDPYGSLFYVGQSASGSPSMTAVDTSAGTFHGCEHMSPYHAECALVATGITSATRLTSDGACHNATASCASGFLYMVNVTGTGGGYVAEPALTVTGCSGATAAVGPIGAGGIVTTALPTAAGSGCKPETTIAVGLAGATSLATVAPVIEGNSLNLPKNSTNLIRCAVSMNDTGPGALGATISFTATMGATASTTAVVGSPSWTFLGTDAALTLAAPTADTTLGAINITLTPSAVTASLGGTCTIDSSVQNI